MAVTTELFRFMTTRRPERALLHRINSRLIRDPRPIRDESLLVTLYAPGPFEPKLAAAEAFAAGPDFVAADDPAILALDPLVDLFRRTLVPGVVPAELSTLIATEAPLFTALLHQTPPAELLQATLRFLARDWDSLYAQVIRGCNAYVSTDYLADALRVYHVLRLLWIDLVLDRAAWSGQTFDEYEVIIDLNRAAQRPAARTGEAAEFRVPLEVGPMMPPVV